MALLGYHQETGLPIYEYRDVIHSKAAIRKAAASGVASFLRRIDIDVDGMDEPDHPIKDLGSLLRLANVVLMEASDALEVGIVPYRWALAREHGYLLRHACSEPEPSIIPAGHVLIASVSALPDAVAVDRLQSRMINKRVIDYQALPHASGYYNYESSSSQCVSTADGPVLVDIEPMLLRDGR